MAHCAHIHHTNLARCYVQLTLYILVIGIVKVTNSLDIDAITLLIPECQLHKRSSLEENTAGTNFFLIHKKPPTMYLRRTND